MVFPIVDTIIGVITILAVIIGVKKGFLKSLLKFITFILSLLMAFFLARGIISMTGYWFGVKAGALAIFDAVFTLVIMIIIYGLFELIFGLFERRITRNMQSRGSEAVGKILGLSIGIVKAMVVVAVAIALVTLLFPGENPVVLQIERSIVGRFIFEKSPLPAFMVSIF